MINSGLGVPAPSSGCVCPKYFLLLDVIAYDRWETSERVKCHSKTLGGYKREGTPKETLFHFNLHQDVWFSLNGSTLGLLQIAHNAVSANPMPGPPLWDRGEGPLTTGHSVQPPGFLRERPSCISGPPAPTP